ncbi:MAG TPA: potassium channel protein [Chitinophagaceae bacterium]|jgi:voltage-gated potassium channel|nr:potassium channel protein [Chitinophagaceae bacterium]
MPGHWTYRLLQPFLVLHFIILIGIFGYMAIEGYTFMEALYMTTIAITTVGFSEVRPLSDSGRLFTIFLLITSWITFAWAIARITQFVITGEINKYFKTRKNMKAITQLNNHVILCGFGRNGQQAARTLKNHNMPFVVIEKEEGSMEKALPFFPELVYLVGDGTDDDLLKKAGIEKAVALITALPVDADNVFIVLSARALNQKLQIISRASEESSYPKLRKAGADNVIMPDKIGGSHMATLVSKPDVIEFMDFLSSEDGESVNMESVPYNQLPPAIKDKSLKIVMEWNKTGVNCLGIKNKEGKFIINPPGETLVTEGCKVIVFGTRSQIAEMKHNLD